MKQKFLFLVVFLATSLFLNAQTEHSVTINAGDIEHLSVTENMDILLLQGRADDKISIDKNVFEKLDVQIYNNNMELSLRRPLSKKEKLTVIVYVSDLKKLSVEGNATVKTRGMLNAPKLDLYLEGSPYLYLFTNGKVNAHAVGDTQIKMKKLPLSSVEKTEKGF